MLKIYIFTHSGGAEVALGEIPETVSGLGDYIYCVTEVTDHFVPLLLFINYKKNSLYKVPHSKKYHHQIYIQRIYRHNIQ